MIPERVITRKDIENRLSELGATPTGKRTDTAEIWRLKEGNHFTVPDGIEGDYYPDWMLNDLEKVIGKLKPQDGATKL